MLNFLQMVLKCTISLGDGEANVLCLRGGALLLQYPTAARRGDGRVADVRAAQQNLVGAQLELSMSI